MSRRTLRTRTTADLAKAARRKGSVALATSVILVGDAPPTEFRIFAAGENPTENGYSVLFDDEAAASVMAAYERHGVDRMIDLEHLSIDQEAPNYDPDARGWATLEVRRDADGGPELWAIDVSWTPDGETRLREKRQRYISPWFIRNTETSRVTEVLNIAIVGMPGTRDAQPLVAASRVTRDLRTSTLSAGTSFDDVRRALADELTDRIPPKPDCMGAWICDVFDASFVYEYDGKLWELSYVFANGEATLGALPVEVKRTYAPVESAAPAALAGRSGHVRLAGGSAMTPEQLASIAEALGLGADAAVEDVIASIGALVKKIQDAANGTPPADAPPADAPPPPEGMAEMQAANAMLLSVTGKTTATEALSEVTRLRAIAADVEAERAKIAQQQAALELGERKDLVIKLQQLGAETPATSGLAEGKLVERLASEPIASLRSRVGSLLAARGGQLPSAPKPPAGDAKADGSTVVDGVELTAVEVESVRRSAKKYRTDEREALSKYAAQVLRQGRKPVKE